MQPAYSTTTLSSTEDLERVFSTTCWTVAGPVASATQPPHTRPATAAPFISPGLSSEATAVFAEKCGLGPLQHQEEKMSETANQKPQSQDQASEDKPQSLTVTHPIFHQVGREQGPPQQPRAVGAAAGQRPHLKKGDAPLKKEGAEFEGRRIEAEGLENEQELVNARELTTMSARKPAANTTKTAATQTAVQSRKSTALLRGSGRLIAHPLNCRPRRPIFIPGRPLRPTRGWREDTRNQLSPAPDGRDGRALGTKQIQRKDGDAEMGERSPTRPGWFSAHSALEISQSL